ncbi:MAG: hypothetical protein IT460_01835 [Planctomycetes bacterium]|nr:hypothetical protein [Planctomycetota bacterium]
MRRLASLVLPAVALACVLPARADGPPVAPPRPEPAATPRAALEAALTPDLRGELAFLEHLGWQLVEDPSVQDVTVVEGRPGFRASIDEARAAGDLRIRVPAGRGAAVAPALARVLPATADGVGSRVAWQQRLRPAAEAVGRRLGAAADAGVYKFPRLLGITSPLFMFSPPGTSWVERGEGVWVPRGSSAAALLDFESKPSLAECLVGQTVMILTMQRELLGDAAFDEAYEPDAVALGPLPGFHATPLGRHLADTSTSPWQALVVRSSEVGTADAGSLIGRYGAAAFHGMTGLLRDQAGTDRCNENIVVVSISAAAAEAFRTQGFARIGTLTQEWLDLATAERGKFMTAAKAAPIRRRIAEIRADPVLAELRVYIHPYGITTVLDVAEKKLKRDKRNLELFPYLSGRDDELYQRYRRVWKARFLRGAPVPR